jgi:hypothetical protein
MPHDLTDAELATAAQACRVPIENAAQRYAALAVKLEAARKRCI